MTGRKILWPWNRTTRQKFGKASFIETTMKNKKKTTRDVKEKKNKERIAKLWLWYHNRELLCSVFHQLKRIMCVYKEYRRDINTERKQKTNCNRLETTHKPRRHRRLKKKKKEAKKQTNDNKEREKKTNWSWRGLSLLLYVLVLKLKCQIW